MKESNNTKELNLIHDDYIPIEVENEKSKKKEDDKAILECEVPNDVNINNNYAYDLNNLNSKKFSVEENSNIINNENNLGTKKLNFDYNSELNCNNNSNINLFKQMNNIPSLNLNLGTKNYNSNVINNQNEINYNINKINNTNNINNYNVNVGGAFNNAYIANQNYNAFYQTRVNYFSGLDENKRKKHPIHAPHHIYSNSLEKDQPNIINQLLLDNKEKEQADEIINQGTLENVDTFKENRRGRLGNNNILDLGSVEKDKKDADKEVSNQQLSSNNISYRNYGLVNNGQIISNRRKKINNNA